VRGMGSVEAEDAYRRAAEIGETRQRAAARWRPGTGSR
jgi:hypothetical protein